MIIGGFQTGYIAFWRGLRSENNHVCHIEVSKTGVPHMSWKANKVVATQLRNYQSAHDSFNPFQFGFCPSHKHRNSTWSMKWMIIYYWWILGVLISHLSELGIKDFSSVSTTENTLLPCNCIGLPLFHSLKVFHRDLFSVQYFSLSIYCH